MKFKKYPSIENHYNAEKVNFEMPVDQKWFVTEKIHGANYAFYADGHGTVKGAKRSSFVGLEDNFYNHEVIHEKYAESIRSARLHSFFDGMNPDVTMIVFGEIFGGNSCYSHKSAYKPIQKGVFYTPEIEFMAFDVAIQYPGDERLHFLSMKDRIAVLGVYIPQVPHLFFGTYETCLELCEKHKDMNSNVPTYFKVENPPVKNVVEGFVISPVDPLFDVYGGRVAFKYKTETFLEKSKGSKDKKQKFLSKEDEKIIQEFLQYLNDNRIDSYLSKEGAIYRKDIGKHIKGVFDDIIEDMKKDGIVIDDTKTVAKLVSRHIANKLLKVSEIGERS